MAKKIMFNDKYSLTQAVLEGRKTMTRRVCKYDRPNETYDIVFPVFEPNDYDNDGNIVSPLNYAFGWKNDKGDFTGWNIPKYKVGEVVAIAQSYLDLSLAEVSQWKSNGNKTTINSLAGWTNKLFTKAELMPHHIRITNIKVERLQGISDGDCLKEGIEEHLKNVQYGFSSNIGYCGQYPFPNPREAFAALIDKIYGKGTWESNSYVFAYEFELID
jgi:hypothetical protein